MAYAVQFVVTLGDDTMLASPAQLDRAAAQVTE